MSGFSSPMMFSPPTGMSKANSLLDLGSSRPGETRGNFNHIRHPHPHLEAQERVHGFLQQLEFCQVASSTLASPCHVVVVLVVVEGERVSPEQVVLPWRCGAANMWAITPEERGKHDKQFDSLAPVLGHVSGEQARKFFLQSGLPPPVLAEIWGLADLDSDGKMDRLEFSIAMKLIKLKLQGRGLPSSLPVVMKQSPAANPASIMTSSARFGMGSMPNLSLAMPPMPSMSILTPVPVIQHHQHHQHHQHQHLQHHQHHPHTHTHHPVPGQPLMLPTAMTLPLMSSLGNAGLPNGHSSLLIPSPAPSNTGWFCSG
ncbi:hypothetical protein CRUP_009504 [Coryphaenoides rupestris]|nr:hypothetical protein CRUP_009504 [Coryphaenoides rupestris]